MGGSSSQVVGYRYFANFLLFIGNPIEALHAINFDKRMWITGRIVPTGDGQLRYVHSPNLYGENEGGISGVICVKYGKNGQYEDSAYAKYMADIGMPVSAYPYQSYISFSGNVLASQFQGMSDEDLQDLADEYEDGIVPGKGFYLGNSGYMKEMLLWVKRIHVRNDGREQWYDIKAEIPESYEVTTTQDGQEFLPTFSGIVSKTITKKKSGATDDITSTSHNVDASLSLVEYLVTSESIPVQSINTSNIETTSQLHYIINSDLVVRITAIISMFGESREFTLLGNVISDNSAWINSTTYKLDVVLVAPKDGENAGEMGFKVVVNNAAQAEDAGWAGHILRSDSTRIYVPPNIQIPIAIYSGDINPIHKIREILTDDTAMNKPESDVNDDNFSKAADRVWLEKLGVSWSITEKSCLEAINELCGHIEAGVRVNRQTGLYEMVLFRDDWFEESEIHAIAVNKIKSMSLEVANADEAINQLNVSYYNRESIKDSSFSIAENASIRNLNGRVNAEDADFPYFMNQRNAAVVAQWKLKQMSSPVWKGSFTTAEYNARKWNRYDLLKLAWPRKWQGTITVRIMKINLGTGTDVSIDFVEVVPYSSELSSNIVIDTPIDVAPQPPLACPYEPFEMPYYLAVMALGQRQVDEELGYENNFGLVGVVAEQPQSNSLYAIMMTHDGTEGEEWLRAATINYEPVADLDQIISKTSTSFTVKDSTVISGLPVGTLIKCGGEWMVFSGIDQETGVVSVKRGALDTLPQAWGMGTKLYFCGNDVAFDSTEYVAGEEVLVSALTTTPSGMLENKGSIGVEMQARAIRPYPPANVRANGEYWEHVAQNSVELTWSDRNRLQQTGGEIIGWYENGVTVESGVTYHYKTIADDNSVISSGTNVASGVAIQQSEFYPHARLQLWTERNGYESLQKVELYLESAIGLMASFIEPIYAVNEYLSVSAKLSNNAVIASLTLESGTLPTGFSIAGTKLQGACTTAGSYTFTLKAIDAMSNEIHKTFTVKIQGALWSQLTFDTQNIIDRISANSWTLGSGNSYTTEAFDSEYALLTGGSSAPMCAGKGITATQNTFSVSMRIKLTKPIVNYAPLWFMGDIASNNHRDSMYINSSYRLESYRQGLSGTGKNTYAITALELDQWYQVGYTFTGVGTSGGTMKIWLDGSLEVSDFYTSSIANFSNLYLAVVRSGGNPIYRDGLIIDNFVVTTGAPRFE